MDKFTVWFTNRELIFIKQNLSIKKCVRKHMPVLIAAMMWGDLKLDNYEYLY